MKNEFKFKLVGHDAEFICRSTETNEPVSMANFTQITLPSCVVYPDNVLLEMNADPTTLDDFEGAINTSLNDLYTLLNEQGLYTVIGQTSAHYPKDQLCDPKAHVIGCEPFSVCTMLGVNLSPPKYQDQWRFAGGHVHLAYDKNLVPTHYLIALLDKELKGSDVKDVRRDAFYGQPGAYREKSYGVEYRSLSNAWMNDVPSLIKSLRKVEAQVNAILNGESL